MKLSMIDPDILKRKALWYLGKYNASRQDVIAAIHRKIIKMNENPDDYTDTINDILDQLNVFIDDHRVALTKIRRYCDQGFCEQMAIMKLRAKGIDRSVILGAIDIFLQEYDLDNYDDRSIIQYAQKKRITQLDDKSKTTLMRRGFGWGTISRLPL